VWPPLKPGEQRRRAGRRRINPNTNAHIPTPPHPTPPPTQAKEVLAKTDLDSVKSTVAGGIEGVKGTLDGALALWGKFDSNEASPPGDPPSFLHSRPHPPSWGPLLACPVCSLLRPPFTGTARARGAHSLAALRSIFGLH
jgi:hypothetical protein